MNGSDDHWKRLRSPSSAAMWRLLRARPPVAAPPADQLEKLGILAAGIAHDFNNLLAIILGNAQALARSLPDSDLRQLAELTAAAAERGAELVGRLSSLTRQDALSPHTVDINETVRGVCGLLQRTIPEDVHFSFLPEIGLRPADIDPSEMEIALLNLVSNACDAMPEGGQLVISTANVHLSHSAAANAPAPGHYVLLAVTDSGTGMSLDVADRAGTAFFTTKERGKGSGLGLNMVYGLVEAAGGHVRIDSAPGSGTAVRLYIPCSGLPGAGISREDESEGDETILVVDDDRSRREEIRSQLRGFGYRVLAVPDGAAALALMASTTRIDLLFIDTATIDCETRWELTIRARWFQPHLRLLYARAVDNPFDQPSDGASFIQRPYRPGDLAHAVRKLIEEPAEAFEPRAEGDDPGARLAHGGCCRSGSAGAQ